MNIACILMASGESRRFGSNKLLCSFRGEPLFRRAVRLVSSLPFRSLLTVTRHREISEYCREQGVPAVLHGLPDRDQAIRLGLKTLQKAASDTLSGSAPPAGCLFCPCDQPLLTERSLAAMMKEFEAHPDSMVRLSWAGAAGAPVIFPSSLFPELMDLPPKCGGKLLPERYPERVRLVEAQFPEELQDVDRPEDLSRLEQAPFAAGADLRFSSGGLTFAFRTVGILICGGKLLLQKTIGKDEYFLPGGHLQQLESTEGALIRECLEELHSRIEILSFAGVGELFFPWEGSTIQQLCFYYRIRFAGAPGIPTSGTFAGFDAEETARYHLEYVWLPLSDLDRVSLYPAGSRPLITEKDRPPVHFIDIQTGAPVLR